MTDCLSEDDDEEHHPVFLFSLIIYPGTPGAERKICCSIPAYAHLSACNNPLPQIVPGETGAINPVFQNRCSYGLMGL